MRFDSTIAVGLMAGLAAGRVVPRVDAPRAIVAHYMVGEIFDNHVRQDIQDAKNIGLDGFALNFDQFAGWSERTVDYMFNNADDIGGFGLFFSFDHGANILNSPMEYADYFADHATRDSYLRVPDPSDNGALKPLLSTFGGDDVTTGQWNEFRDAVRGRVGDILIVPGFYKQGNPSSNFFNDFPALDGVFNWNSWPQTSEGRVAVSADEDRTFLNAAHNTGRIFMMGMSPVQHKHLSDSDNWYRRGEDNLENRFGQILDLQPDLVQLQSWNDAGEGHYMGNLWPEPLNEATTRVTDGYDHTTYWAILGPFIQAWKNGDRNTGSMYPTNGQAVQGAFWHHTLLIDGGCTNDPVPKSQDIPRVAEDAVSGVILVPQGKTNLVGVVNVDVNGEMRELGNTGELSPGFNKFKFTGLSPGKVQLEVWDGSTMVGGGYGSIEVKREAELCNYQFQVVAVPS